MTYPEMIESETRCGVLRCDDRWLCKINNQTALVASLTSVNSILKFMQWTAENIISHILVQATMSV